MAKLVKKETTKSEGKDKEKDLKKKFIDANTAFNQAQRCMGNDDSAGAGGFVKQVGYLQGMLIEMYLSITKGKDAIKTPRAEEFRAGVENTQKAISDNLKELGGNPAEKEKTAALEKLQNVLTDKNGAVAMSQKALDLAEKREQLIGKINTDRDRICDKIGEDLRQGKSVAQIKQSVQALMYIDNVHERSSKMSEKELKQSITEQGYKNGINKFEKRAQNLLRNVGEKELKEAASKKNFSDFLFGKIQRPQEKQLQTKTITSPTKIDKLPQHFSI